MLILSSEKLYKVYAKMSKHKFNIFYILFPDDKIKMVSEITLQKLALKYSAALSFDEIFSG